VFLTGFAEPREHDRAGDAVGGGDREGVAGVVVEPGQDLAVGSWAAIGPGEPVVGEVGLPALVGLVGLESDVGGLGLLLRLRSHQAGLGQIAGHRGAGDGEVVVVFEVPPDGVGAGVQAGRGELCA
jgi:hypothetical protein